MPFLAIASLVVSGLFAGTASSSTSEESRTVLIAVKPGRASSALRFLRGHGRVGAPNADGLYKMVLREGENADSLRRRILSRGDVDSVHPATADSVDSSTLKSVDDHIAYIKASKRVSGAGKGEKAEVDYFESLREYLYLRTTGTDGVFDLDAYNSAIQQREAMPKAALPTNPAAFGGVGTDSTSGTWSYVGPKNINVPYQRYFGLRPIAGRVNAIAIDPVDPNIMYVGSANGGVWKTTNGSAYWEPLSDNWPVMAVSCLTLDPNNHNTIYAGTGDFHGFKPYGMGIMKSTDAGKTWTNIGQPKMGTNTVISSIMVLPENSNVLIATTGRGMDSKGRVWRSTDGGANWLLCIDDTFNPKPLPEASWCDIDYSQNTATGRRLYVVGGDKDANYIYRSKNGGLTWSRLNSPQTGGIRTMDIAASKMVNGVDQIFLLTPTLKKIWRANDAGATTVPTWVNITGNLPLGPEGKNWDQGTYDFHITTSVSNNDPATQKNLVFVGLLTLAVNVGGNPTSWTDLGLTMSTSAKSHNDQHFLIPNPKNPTHLFAGNDGGIYSFFLTSLAPPTASVAPLNKVLGITQFYAMAIHPNANWWIMGGTQDNGTPASLGDLTNWGNPGAGDGGYCAIDTSNGNRQYVSSQDGTVYKTTDGWLTTRTEITPDYGGDVVPFIARMTMGSGTQASNFFVGTNYLWRYSGTASTWKARLGGTKLSTTDAVRSIGIAPNDAGRVYTGSGDKDDTECWMTTNIAAATPTWTRIDNGPSAGSSLPNRPIVALEPSPTNSNSVLAGLSWLAPGNLWRCTNATSPTRVWFNVSGSGATALPGVPVNAIAYDPMTPDSTWYVGTDMGVFVTYDAGSTWLNATNAWGLPNTQVNALKIWSGDSGVYLYAATFGRGIWKIRLKDVELSGFNAPDNVTGGQTFEATAALTARAGSGGFDVTVFTSNTALIPNPPILTIPENAEFKTFQFETRPTATDTTVTLTALGPGGPKADTITVRRPKLDGMYILESIVVGGFPATGKVVLNTKAPAGGINVAITDNSDPIFGYPLVVNVPAGNQNQSFVIKTSAVTTNTAGTVTASLNGITRSDSVIIFTGGLDNVHFSPSTVSGGTSVTGVAELTGAAHFPGVTVNLVSGDPHLVVPASVFIPEGASSVEFQAQTTAVETTINVTVTVTCGSVTKRAGLTITH